MSSLTPPPAPPMLAATLRLARAEDVPWLLQELRKFSDLYGTETLALYPEDEFEAHAVLAEVVEEGVLYVAEGAAGELLGFIGAQWGTSPYNRAVEACAEMFWWTTREARAAGVGMSLLRLLEREARAAGVAVLTVTVLPGRTPDGVERALLKRGYTEGERVYVLELGRSNAAVPDEAREATP